MVRWITVLLSLALLPVPAAAEEARDLLAKSQTAGAPKSLDATLTMVLRDASGREELRTLELRKSGTDKQVAWFVKPTAVRGTAFLRIGSGSAKKMWLYLPAFKKLERISGAKENENFLGSDFTYGDMADRDLSAYSHAFAPDRELDGQRVRVVVSTPLDTEADSAYGKIETLLDPVTAVQLGEDIYDAGGDLVKQKRNRDFRVVGGYRMPGQVVMADLQKNHSTELRFERIEPDKAIADSQFTPDALQRIRP